MQRLLTCNQDITSLPRPHYSPRSTSVSRGTSPAQLTLFPEIPSSQCLTVEAVPPDQRVTPDCERYILVLKPSCTRLPGHFFGDEIDKIIAATKGWNWTLDRQGRFTNLGQLEIVIDQILGGLK